MATRSKTNKKRAASSSGPRGIWSGSISFGLLQIPVTLHPAEVRTEQIHFHMLDRRDLSRVQYKRVSAKSGRVVEWKDVVKGYELGDEIVVLDKEDLAKANVKATKTIDIEDFVPAASLEPMFFETPYYLVPRTESTKAYVLLRDALAKKEAAAIATFVLRTRERLVALIAVDDAIVLEVLRFGHELRTPSEMGLPHLPSSRALGARELQMGEKLVDSMMSEWRPEKYKDTYHDDVRAIVRQKAKHGETTPHNEPEPLEEAGSVVDLFELLKSSLGPGARRPHAHPGAGAKKRRSAPSKRKAA